MSPDRVGYVLKMYPRFSETFIVTELLEMQAIGVPFEVFSLRLPNDGRFHASLSEMHAPVSYLGAPSVRAAQLWETLGTARSQLPGWSAAHDDVFDLEVGDAAQAVELARLVVERDITHLHAHFASVAARVARVAARLAEITYSVTTHAKDIFHDDVDSVDLGRTLRDARTVVAISEYNRDHLAGRHPEIAARISLVRNGLDLSAFPFVDDLAGRANRVAAVGRLVEKKGFDVLVRAVGLLRDHGVELGVDLVGTGAQESALRELIDTMGLADTIVLHGAQPQHRVREIICTAAAFAAPCVIAADGNRDGLPTVLVEAMALGTPCVATEVTGIGEVVTDGVTGLMVPANDHVGLALALRRLLADRATGAALARAARQRVQDRHDSRRQVATLAATFPRTHQPGAGRSAPAARGAVA